MQALGVPRAAAHRPRARVRFDPLAAAARALGALRFRLIAAFFAARDGFAGLRERAPAASTMTAYGAVVLMAAILVKDMLAPTPAESSVTPEPDVRPAWTEVPRAHGAFALEFPALDSLGTQFVVRRHRDGGGRKDEFTWGSAGAPGAFARVVLYRPGGEGEATSDPVHALAQVAAATQIDAELADAARQLDTKFGRLAAIHMSVKGPEGPRACLAVARAWQDPRLGLVAWWCSPGPEIVPAGRLACLLDRLTLMGAGGDDRLAEFFARAELRRDYCRLHTTLLSPTPQRQPDWITDKSGPKLRGRLAGR